ncbi:MAG: LPXTG cell wall anchor domain-containing protein [Actinobacteria bacterium]|nr:LPXTG cell wall anchor domain-containing protein [Actinomycetota bacterium]
MSKNRLVIRTFAVLATCLTILLTGAGASAVHATPVRPSQVAGMPARVSAMPKTSVDPTVPEEESEGTEETGTDPMVIGTSPESADFDLDADSHNDVGIIIAIVAGVVLLGGAAVFMVRRRRQSESLDD